jgi:hypothetical protein
MTTCDDDEGSSAVGRGLREEETAGGSRVSVPDQWGGLGSCLKVQAPSGTVLAHVP